MNDKDKANSKEVIYLKAQIQPGETKTITERIKADGTLENISVRFYQGQQLDLHVFPYIHRKGEKAGVESMLTFPEDCDQFLSGDDDYNNFPVIIPVYNDDEIKVRVENKDATNIYTLHIEFAIDYYAGAARVV